MKERQKAAGEGDRWISPCCNIQVEIDTVFRDPVWGKGSCSGAEVDKSWP